MFFKDWICDVDLFKNFYDQEDGIFLDVEKVLYDLKQSSDLWMWELIWNLLFLCDIEIFDLGLFFYYCLFV